MKSRHSQTSRFFPLAATVALSTQLALLATGCSEASTEEPAVAALAMIEGALDGADPISAERFSDRPGIGAARIAAACDPNPTMVEMDACGREVVGSADFVWQDCELDEPDGPRWTAHGATSGEFHVRSSMVGACDDASVSLDRDVDFAIDLSPGDGMTASLSGAVTTTVTGLDGGDPVFATVVTLQREMHRGDQTMHAELEGDLRVALDEEDGSRTTDGTASMTMEHPRRGTMNLGLVFSGVRRESGCAWPTAGTLERTIGDGEPIVVALGPECGEAMIDGESVVLDEVASPGGGRRRGRP